MLGHDSLRRAARAGFALVLAVACGCGDGDEAASSEEDNLGVFNAPPLGPEPSGQPTKWPILISHGYGVTGFHERIQQALEADGHRVYRTQVPPYNSIEVRAQYLKDEVDAALAKWNVSRVNIIAHSTGGFDARGLVHWHGYGDRVATITTISTPHRGTRVADVALKIVSGQSDAALNALASAFGVHFNELATNTSLRDALNALSVAGAAQFNAEVFDDPQVFYQSWAGVSSVACVPNPKDSGACENRMLAHPGRADCMDPALVASGAIVANGQFIPNDGLVAVESAQWGEFRGCVPADHADEVSQFGDSGKDGRTGFDAVRFYRNLAFNLAQYGL